MENFFKFENLFVSNHKDIFKKKKMIKLSIIIINI